MYYHGRMGDTADAPRPVETVGQRIRRLRTALGLNQSELAHAVGLTEGAIRQVEGGQSKSVSLAAGVRLAAVLGVEVRYIAFGDGDGTEENRTARPLPPSRVEQVEAQVAAIETRLAKLEKKPPRAAD